MGFLLSPLKANSNVILLFNQPIDRHFERPPPPFLTPHVDCLSPDYAIDRLLETSCTRQRISRRFLPLHAETPAH